MLNFNIIRSNKSYLLRDTSSKIFYQIFWILFYSRNFEEGDAFTIATITHTKL